MLQQTAEGARNNDPFASESEKNIELIKLEKQANEFNNNVNILKTLRPKGGPVYLLVQKLTALMGVTIDLRRMTITINNGSITIGGLTKTEELATAFKDKLQSDSQFTNVDLPLRDLNPQIDGTIDFIVRLELKDLAS